jgi:hypothetical protein
MYEIYINDEKYEVHSIYIDPETIKKLSRSEDLPSVIHYNRKGDIVAEWHYKNGNIHRENDKPAHSRYFSNGTIKYQKYYINDRVHRMYDKPAIISYKYSSGRVSYEAYSLHGIIYQYRIYSKNKTNRLQYETSKEHKQFYEFLKLYKENKLNLVLFIKDENKLIRTFSKCELGIYDE